MCGVDKDYDERQRELQELIKRKDRRRLLQIRRDLQDDDGFDIELCAPGEEPSIEEESNRRNGYRLGGTTGLRHWIRRKPEIELRDMLKRDLGVNLTPFVMRTWILTNWNTIARHAHRIHDGGP